MPAGDARLSPLIHVFVSSHALQFDDMKGCAESALQLRKQDVVQVCQLILLTAQTLIICTIKRISWRLTLTLLARTDVNANNIGAPLPVTSYGVTSIARSSFDAG